MRLTQATPVTHTATDDHVLRFAGQRGEQFVVSILDHNLIRVCQWPDGLPRLDRTWMIVDQSGTTPREGRQRDDLSPFALPSFSVEKNTDTVQVTTDQIQVSINLADFRLTWHTASGIQFAADTVHRAYPYDRGGRSVFHYMQRNPDEHYYGFGDKTGPLNKHGRRMILRNVDALGYNAKSGDPLYKHVPFYVTFNPNTQIAYGLLYDNLSTTTFDMGREVDAYHGFYRYYQAEDGDIDYYMIYGPTIPDVVRKLAKLTGFMTLPPRWSLGYLGSTMTYTERPDAQAALQQFIDLRQQHDIPCDMFQLSSGYTTGTDGNRYVFNWNRNKIPDPQMMVDGFHQAGIKLSANVKPYLLKSHPLYEEVETFGGFIQAVEEDKPEPAHLWSGGIGDSAAGAYLDFSNPRTYQWWQGQLQRQLLDYGIDSIWDDNNEFEIWDDAARCHGFGNALPIGMARPIQTLLMNRASYQAQQQNRPNERPFVLTRAGCPGIQRYAQTWTGDNATSWNTLRFNIPMGLGMSLSGIPNIGHDVGGFYGPKPDPELFVRWLQNGIFHPRFTIHSFNSDGSVNEPWMYPEYIDLVRDIIRLRYAFIPYFYTLFFNAAHMGDPIIRPLVYEFPEDERCHTASFEFMVGSHLLVASVLEPGAQQRAVYLPAGANWYTFDTHEYYVGGQTVNINTPLERIPLFVREGGLISMQSRSGNVDDPHRIVHVFPHRDTGVSRFTLIEDDGISLDYQLGKYAAVSFKLESAVEELKLTIDIQGDYVLPYEGIEVVLPDAENRPLITSRPARRASDHRFFVIVTTSPQ